MPASEPAGPQVFISFAGPDRGLAERLAADLEQYGIRTFFSPHSIDPGENFPVRLSRELAASDYFVLLVSESSVDRPWVEEEWSVAIQRQVSERRAFLFVLRLDETPPPFLLSARNFLDAFADWEGSVRRLVETWRRDWDARRRHVAVLPAPGLADSGREDTVGIYVFNQALSVEHFMRVPPGLWGRRLYALVRASLALKDQVEGLGGKIGLELTYSLYRDGDRIAEESDADDGGIVDGDALDLIVHVQQFGPGQTTVPVEYRASGSEGLDRRLAADLFRAAFRHLLP